MTDSIDQAVVAMQRGAVVDITPNLAMAAAKLSLEWSLPMADSLILTTARAHNATIWTQDTDFKGLPGVKYFPRIGGGPLFPEGRGGASLSSSPSCFFGFCLLPCHSVCSVDLSVAP